MALGFVNAGTFVSANSSPQTFSLPSGHAKDNWLLLFLIQSSASGVTFGPPAGWNSVARNSNATRGMTIEVYAKLDGGSESNPSVTCSSAAGGWGGAILAWSGGNRSTLEDQTEVASDAAAAATFQPTGITTQTNGAWVVSFAGTKDDNALNHSVANGFTLRASGTAYDGTTGNGSDYSIGVADKNIAIAGAATCPTWQESVNGNDAWVALTLALKPAVDVTATPGVASLSTSAFAPTVTATNNVKVTPGVKALTVTRLTPTVLTPRLVTPGVVALTTTRFTPTVSTPRLVTPPTKALTITRFAPTVSTPRTVTPSTKALVITRFAPTVSAPRLVTPGTRAIVLTAFAPIVTAGSGITVVPGTRALVLTNFAPTVLTPRVAVPGTRALVLTRFAPTVSAPRVVVPGVRALVLTCMVPSALVGSDVVAVPGTRVLVVTCFAPLVIVTTTPAPLPPESRLPVRRWREPDEQGVAPFRQPGAAAGRGWRRAPRRN